MSPYLEMYLLGAATLVSGVIAWRFSQPLTGLRTFANCAMPAGAIMLVMIFFLQFIR